MKEHVTETLSSCYGSLAVLRKLRHLAPFLLRKELAESLVLSKIDYCDVVYSPLRDYQLKHLQRIQNACAAFVLGHNAILIDVISFNWLPERERREFNLLKMTHKALYNESWLNTC